MESITTTIHEALVLLGKAICHMSVECHSGALTKLNPDLKFKAEDYSKALPFLFETGFEQKAKERTEALKCLKTTKQNTGQPKKFVSGDRPE